MTTRIIKAHVKRCFGIIKGSDGTDHSISIDMLRFEEITFQNRDGAQNYLWTLTWGDGSDEVESDVGGNGERIETILKVPDPEADTSGGDGSEATNVPIRITKRLTLQVDRIKTKYYFKNERDDSVELKRTVKVMRVYHRKTNVDTLFDGGGVAIVDMDQYAFTDDEPDKSQYIDFEVTQEFPINLRYDHQKLRQVTHFDKIYRDKFNIDVDANVSSGVNSSGAEVIPMRTDPMQIALNVSWQSHIGVFVLGDASCGVQVSFDGRVFSYLGSLEFKDGGGVNTGAYGGGMFVLAGNYRIESDDPNDEMHHGYLAMSSLDGQSWSVLTKGPPGSGDANVKYDNDTSIFTITNRDRGGGIATVSSPRKSTKGKNDGTAKAKGVEVKVQDGNVVTTRDLTTGAIVSQGMPKAVIDTLVKPAMFCTHPEFNPKGVFVVCGAAPGDSSALGENIDTGAAAWWSEDGYSWFRSSTDAALGGATGVCGGAPLAMLGR